MALTEIDLSGLEFNNNTRILIYEYIDKTARNVQLKKVKIDEKKKVYRIGMYGISCDDADTNYRLYTELDSVTLKNSADRIYRKDVGTIEVSQVIVYIDYNNKGDILFAWKHHEYAGFHTLNRELENILLEMATGTNDNKCKTYNRFYENLKREII